MWEMVFKKTRKLTPLFDFVCIISASPPLTQLQFFLEPLTFPCITELCSIYGQTVLNTVYYCIRTYVYYIHREKEIFLGKWRGDMTVVTLKSSKVMTFKIPTRQQRVSNLVINNTNDISLPGVLHQSSIPEMSEHLSYHYQYPLVCTYNTCSDLNPAVGAGPCMSGDGLYGDADPPTGHDCPGGAVGCSCGGKVVGACKSGWYCDNSHPKPVICLPPYSAISGAGRHVTGAVISLFSSTYHHNQILGTQ